MQTHTREAITTVVGFLVIVGAVHVGIWFRLFGVPDFTVLNWPFHYFWFVVGAPLSILAAYGAYYWYVGTMETEKGTLHDQHDAGSEPAAEPTTEPEGGDGS